MTLTILESDDSGDNDGGCIYAHDEERGESSGRIRHNPAGCQREMATEESPRPLQPSPAQEQFVSAVRKAVLGQDDVIHGSSSSDEEASPSSLFTKQRINPVVLRDDFVVKACNIMEMCCQGTRVAQQQQNAGSNSTRRRGHIKIEQAFRSKGSFIEGWIFVRWMEVGWSSAGFKAHRLGSLPLVMFPRKQSAEATDTSDQVALQDTLDKIMHELYPVLVECFPECDIVPVQSSEELWKPARVAAREGSELQDALARAAFFSEKSSNSFTTGTTSMQSSESNRSLEVPPLFEEATNTCIISTNGSSTTDYVDVEAAELVLTEDDVLADDTTVNSQPVSTSDIQQNFQCKVTGFECLVTIWALCLWAAILFIICWLLVHY